jgi:hypothetical protein
MCGLVKGDSMSLLYISASAHLGAGVFFGKLECNILALLEPTLVACGVSATLCISSC